MFDSWVPHFLFFALVKFFLAECLLGTCLTLYDLCLDFYSFYLQSYGQLKRLQRRSNSV